MRPSLSDVRALAERQITTTRQQVADEESLRRKDVPDRALLWLALTPTWTVPLADHCGFPTAKGVSPEATLRDLFERGFCRIDYAIVEPRSQGQPPTVEERFFLEPDRQEQERRRVRDREGHDFLLDETRLIAGKLLKAMELPPPLPSALRRWAHVAVHAGRPGELSHAFLEELERALANEGPDEARFWIEQLKRIETLQSGPVTTLLQRALRRLTRYERLTNDRAHLKGYMVREEQLVAYRELMEGSDTTWALHFLGGGEWARRC